MLVSKNNTPRKILDGPVEPLYFYKRPMLVCKNNSLRKIPDGPVDPLYFYKRPLGDVKIILSEKESKYLMVQLINYISTSDRCRYVKIILPEKNLMVQLNHYISTRDQC